MGLTSGYSKIIIAFCIATLLFQEGFSQAGSIDLSFGHNGVVQTKLLHWNEARAVSIQSDNKIVVAGGTALTNGSSFLLARYNTDGALDSSFDQDGMLISGFIGFAPCAANSCAIQADGKIVAAGFTFFDQNSTAFAVARYNANGSIDSSFGVTGKLTTKVGVSNSSRANSTAIQSDGK